MRNLVFGSIFVVLSSNNREDGRTIMSSYFSKTLNVAIVTRRQLLLIQGGGPLRRVCPVLDLLIYGLTK